MAEAPSSDWNMWTYPFNLNDALKSIISEQKGEPRPDTASSITQNQSTTATNNEPAGRVYDGSALFNFYSEFLESTPPPPKPRSLSRKSRRSRKSDHIYFVYPGKQEKDPSIIDVLIYIESRNPHYKLPEPPRLDVSVMTLTGEIIDCKMAVDGFQTNRYVCTFKLGPHGPYTVSVRTGYGANMHIQGSPLRIDETDAIKRYRLLKDSQSGWTPSLNNLPYAIKFQPERNIAKQKYKPTGIAIHPDSNSIYVTDTEAHEVRRYKYSFLDGVITLDTRFGSFGTEPSCFRRPSGVAVDNKHHRVVIADKYNHRISIFDLDGQFIQSFGQRGDGNGEFMHPHGVAVSPDGNLIAVADSFNHRVQLFNGAGVYLRHCEILGHTEQGGDKKEMPRHVTFKDTGGVILVTSYNGWSIFAFDIYMDKKLAITLLDPLNCPRGVAMNCLGQVLIGDEATNSIKVISEYMMPLPEIRKAGNELLNQPIDIATAPAGLICVLEASGTIRLFQLQD